MVMSAFGVEDNRLSKADNRRGSVAAPIAIGTGIGAGGWIAGGRVGQNLTARHFGVKAGEVYDAQRAITRNLPKGSTFRDYYRAGKDTIPHLRAIDHGGEVGAAVGAAAGVGAYALHRRNRRRS